MCDLCHPKDCSRFISFHVLNLKKKCVCNGKKLCVCVSEKGRTNLWIYPSSVEISEYFRSSSETESFAFFFHFIALKNGTSVGRVRAEVREGERNDDWVEFKT